MKSLKTIAAGAAIAGALGFAAIGVSEGVASAAPPVPGGHFAQDPGWGHGHGPGWRGPGWGGPGYWAPPPPPPPYYGGYAGYGGYGPPPPPCLSGPLGFVQVCA
jgi:hypothetical protein